MKGFALGLAFKQRRKATRKSPILLSTSRRRKIRCNTSYGSYFAAKAPIAVSRNLTLKECQFQSVTTASFLLSSPAIRRNLVPHFVVDLVRFGDFLNGVTFLVGPDPAHTIRGVHQQRIWIYPVLSHKYLVYLHMVILSVNKQLSLQKKIFGAESSVELGLHIPEILQSRPPLRTHLPNQS